MPLRLHPGDLSRLAGLVQAAPPTIGRTRLVAIDGPSGSGKTTLADRLAAELAAPTVHMDDLYPGWDGLAAGIERATHWVVGALRAGRPVRYRVWDWANDVEGDWMQLPEADVLVLEGCGAAVGPLGEAATLRVWLEAEVSVRHARGLARDPGFAAFWDRWAEQERAVYAADQTRAHADVTVDTTTAPTAS
jgi:uridine kinase